MLAFCLATSIAVGWLAVEKRQAEKQRLAVEGIKELGADVSYDYAIDDSGNQIPNAQPPGPEWLRRLLGDDFSANVLAVFLRDREITGSELVNLKCLSELKALNLWDHCITDAGMVDLQGLNQLQTLDLRENEITDSGLTCLKGLTHLQVLTLGSTEITDAGLESIKGLPRLRTLYLCEDRHHRCWNGEDQGLNATSLVECGGDGDH